MAGEPKFKEASHSKSLFTDENSAPIIFFMRPCSERQFLRPLIEHGGGKVTGKAGSDCIKLAEKGCTVSANGFISTQFVEDCVKMNKYLEPSDYSVRPGTVVSQDSDNSFSSSDSMSPASTVIKTTKSSGKGRTKYTKIQDVAIITYIVTEKKYRETSGMRLWKDMELLGVTNHSADSMNTRYRKNILPNIENYKHEIPSKWISLLTGVITKEKEPEFCADALFKLKPKQVPTHTKKQAEDGPTTSQYFSTLFSSETDTSPAKKYRQTLAISRTLNTTTNNSNDKSRTDKQDKTSADTETKNLQKKKHADQDSKTEASEDEEAPSIIKARGLRKRQQIVTAEQGSPSKMDILEKAEHKEVPKYSKGQEVKNLTEDKSILDLGKEDSDSEEPVKSVEPRHLRKRQQREIDQPSPIKSKRTAVEKTKTDEILKSSKAQKADFGQDELDADGMSDTIELRNLRKRSEKIASNERSPSKIHSVEKESGSACEEKSSPEKTKQKGKNIFEVLNDCEMPKKVEKQGNKPKEIGSHHSSKEHNLQSITNCSNNSSSPSKSSMDSDVSRLERKRRLDIVLRRIDNSDDSSSDSDGTHEVGKGGKQKIGDRKSRKKRSDDVDKEEIHRKKSPAAGVDTEADEVMDSFDTMLAGLAKEDIKSKTSSDRSNQDRETRGNKKQTSHSSGPVNNDDDADDVRITRAGQKANQQTRKGPADSTTDNVYSFDSDTEEEVEEVDPEIVECRQLFKGIAKHYGLPSEYVRKLLWRNHGHINRTVCWIKFGPYSPYPPSWETRDDQCLTDGEEKGRLIEKFGALDVAERLKFLGQA